MPHVRGSQRHYLRLKMIFDDGEEYVSAFVNDVSATGLMLEAPKPLPLGHPIRLEPVEEIENAWFELRGRVTRCYEIDPDASIARHGAPLYAIAVQLVDVSPVQELAIRKAIRDVEKSAFEQHRARL